MAPTGPLPPLETAGSPVRYELDQHPSKFRFGVIALDADLVFERDLHLLYPPDVAFYTARVHSVHPITPENLEKMGPMLQDAASTILPGADLDVVVYGCTSGAINIGPERVNREIQAVKPGALVVNPATAAVEGLRHIGATKITLVTPYLDSVNQTVRLFFEKHGIGVLNIVGFGLDNDYEMSYVPPSALRDAAIAARHPAADAVFLSCTATRSVEAIDAIEAALGLAALCSNQCLVWHSLTAVGYRHPIRGYGSLLAKLGS